MSLDLINPVFCLGQLRASRLHRTKAKLNELKSSGFGAVNLSLNVMHIGYRIALTDYLRIAENEEASGRHYMA